MTYDGTNVSTKMSDRPSVIFPCTEPKKTPQNVVLIDTGTDQSEDEDEPNVLTNDMLLDLKARFNSIKECFNDVTDNITDDVTNEKTGQSDVVSLGETTVVNSIVTKGVIKNAITQENSKKAVVTQENVNKEDIIKDDVTNNDVTKNDVTKNSTQNAQTETKRTKTSQKRPSKSNIQFQVPKKLQVKVTLTTIFARSFSQIASNYR